MEPRLIAARGVVLEYLGIDSTIADAVVLRLREDVFHRAEIFVLGRGGEALWEESRVEDLVLNGPGEEPQRLAWQQEQIERLGDVERATPGVLDWPVCDRV